MPPNDSNNKGKAHSNFSFSEAASLCACAFFNDALDSYFFPCEADRISKQKRLYSYFLRANAENISISSPQLESLTIVEKPFEHKNIMSLAHGIPGLSLVKVGPISLSKMIYYQLNASTLRKRLIKDPYWYLALIATSPEYQRKGYARALLMPMLLKAEKKKEPFFLDTHNAKNISFYEKLGFRIIYAQAIGNMPFIHYCMIR